MPTTDNNLSSGEAGRSIARIERTLDKLDGKVDALDDKLDGWRDRVTKLEGDAIQNARDIASIERLLTKQENRRWMLYLAVVAAVLAFLSQLYFGGVT